MRKTHETIQRREVGIVLHDQESNFVKLDFRRVVVSLNEHVFAPQMLLRCGHATKAEANTSGLQRPAFTNSLPKRLQRMATNRIARIDSMDNSHRAVPTWGYCVPSSALCRKNDVDRSHPATSPASLPCSTSNRYDHSQTPTLLMAPQSRPSFKIRLSCNVALNLK